MDAQTLDAIQSVVAGVVAIAATIANAYVAHHTVTSVGARRRTTDVLVAPHTHDPAGAILTNGTGAPSDPRAPGVAAP